MLMKSLEIDEYFHEIDRKLEGEGGYEITEIDSDNSEHRCNNEF